MKKNKKINQTKMLHEILSKITIVIKNWNPKFVIDEETSSKSLKILNNFKKCKDLLTNTTLPKKDPHMVGVYYSLILKSLKEIRTDELLTTYGGDVSLKPLSEYILEKVTNLANLPN